MKIIIYGTKVPESIDENMRLVSSIFTLNRLIELYPSDDIEGIILSDAKTNHEFIAILQRIYDHKKNLQRYDNFYPPFYENFRIHIRDKFKIDLTP
jgi:hypothetical protein